MNKQEKEYVISRYNDPDLTIGEKVQIQTWRQEDREVEEMLREYEKLDRGLERLAGPVDLRGVDFDKFASGVRDLLPARRRSAAVYPFSSFSTGSFLIFTRRTRRSWTETTVTSSAPSAKVSPSRGSRPSLYIA